MSWASPAPRTGCMVASLRRRLGVGRSMDHAQPEGKTKDFRGLETAEVFLLIFLVCYAATVSKATFNRVEAGRT